MKVAVCFSGKTYPDSGKLVNMMKNRFPTYDFFYGTWEGEKSPFPKQTHYFKEPEVDYHPYLDIPLDEYPIQRIKDILAKAEAKGGTPEAWAKNFQMMNKANHQTKQIFAHSYMLDTIPEEYDMIIRARWDLHYYDKFLPLENFVDESYNMNKAIGFSKKLSHGNHAWWSAKGTHRHPWWDCFLMDLLIIHPRKLFDRERMYELHNSKKLIAAEFGWWQVLSQPYKNNHDCYFARIGMTSRDGMRKMG